MSNEHSSVVALLQDPQIRKSIEEICRKAEAEGATHLTRSEQYFSPWSFLSDRLQKPWPITQREVDSIAGHIFLGTSETFEAAYSRFVHRMEMECYEGCGPDTARVARIPGLCFAPTDQTGFLSRVLFAARNGFCVDIKGVPVPSRGGRDPWTMDLLATAEGPRFTSKAFARAFRETTRLLRSASRSLVLSGHFALNLKRVPNPDHDPTYPTSDSSTPFDLKSFAEATKRGPTIAVPDDPDIDQDGVTSLGLSLELYWPSADRKGTFLRRLRNALCLLMEADHSRHPTVSLALSCAALEAMLVESKDQISDSLARNAATLLQPQAGLRHDAIKAVKRLYNKRSDLVHGNSVERFEEAGYDARKLAAAVFKGLIEWLKFWRRTTGDKAEPKHFFEDLEVAKIEGKPMIAVPARLAACLPTISG